MHETESDRNHASDQEFEDLLRQAQDLWYSILNDKFNRLARNEKIDTPSER